MVWFILKFLISALIIFSAGYLLTKFADKIAQLTGWGRLFVGGLLLAGATSLPEFMVDLHATQMGLPNLAIGDLLGSCLFNLLILALLDFTYPSKFKGTAFSPQFLHHSLAAVLTILLASILGIAILTPFYFSLFGASIFSWTLLIVYLYGLRLIFLEGSQDGTKNEPVKNEPIETEPKKMHSLFFAFSGYLFSAFVILFTAPFLVEAAEQLAKQTGLGQSFIGTTLVALTTSLPELVSTLVAFRMGAPDLALGNVFGSNAFNLLLVLPLDLLKPGPLFTEINKVHAITAFGIVTATGAAVMGQLYRKKRNSIITEPSSVAVVGVILIILILLFQLSPKT